MSIVGRDIGRDEERSRAASSIITNDAELLRSRFMVETMTTLVDDTEAQAHPADVRPLRAAAPVIITNDAELLLTRFMVETMTALIDDAEAQAYPAEGMPEGWTQIIVRRKRETRGVYDKYWVSPKNSYKFNAEVKVRRFLAVLDQVGGDEVVAYRVYMKKGKNGGSGNPKARPSLAASSIITNDAELLLSRFMVETMTTLVDDTEAQAHPAKGMPEGWTQIIVRRKKGVIRDKHWFSPKESYKFNAEIKVRRFLALLDQVGGDEVMAYRLYKKCRDSGTWDPTTFAESSKRDASTTAGISDAGSIKYEKRARISPINVSNVDEGVHDPTSVSKNLFAKSYDRQPVEGLPKGWTRILVPRKKENCRDDPYYFSPKQSYKFNSMAKVRRFLVSLDDAGGDEVAAYVNFGGSKSGRAGAIEASTIGQKRKMTRKSVGTADDVSNKRTKKQRVPIVKAYDKTTFPVSQSMAPNASNAPLVRHTRDTSAIQQHAEVEAKQVPRYKYGDRYSQQNVRARKNSDGTVQPATTPKILPDGMFAKPIGRQRKDMDWDPIKGCWFPVPTLRTDDVEKEIVCIDDDDSESVRILSHALFGSGKIVASSSNLNPVNVTEAMVPYDPLCNDDWSMSNDLEREIAWFTEESRLLIPVNDYPTHLLPLELNFVMAHGSMQLREKMKVHHLNIDSSTVVDGYTLLLRGRQNGNCAFNHGVFSRLRKRAHDALRLGYRRSESIKIALLGARIKKVHKYQRKSPTIGRAHEMNIVAFSVPQELNKLEEEVAWLVEESLIIMPTQTEQWSKTIVSAGLTEREADWSFVRRHASVPLSKLLDRVGDRRPLQRIVRCHDTEVMTSFVKRRNEIFNLLLSGYRRITTQHDLPNHDTLVASGMAHILTIRHTRYIKFSSSGGPIQDYASSQSLQPACSQRLSDITNSPRKGMKSVISDANRQFNSKSSLGDEVIMPVLVDDSLRFKTPVVKTITPTLIEEAEAQPHPAEGMPEGWTQIIVRRKEGVIRDKYWLSPKESYKFNAKVKVRRFLAILDQVGGDEVMAYRLYMKKGKGSWDPTTFTVSESAKHEASIMAGTFSVPRK